MSEPSENEPGKMTGASQRRSPGEGHVRQTPNGRWLARLRVRDPVTGKATSKVRRRRAKTEAMAALRQLQTELDSKGSIGDGRATINEAVDRWLNVQRGRRNRRGEPLSPKTMELPEWRASIISEGLGGLTIRELRVDHCDRFLQEAAEGIGGRRPIGRTHLPRVKSALVGVLDNAMREGLANRNVAALAELPAQQAERTERTALSQPQLDRLDQAARGTATGALIVLCGRLALRPAEARALCWSDIDFVNLTVTVVRQLDSSRNPTDPKTRLAARKLGIGDRHAEALAHWRDVQSVEAQRMREAWTDSDLVVTSARGTAVDRNNANRDLARVCEQAGVPTITPYELRHTALTLMAAKGFTNWQLADFAGTSARMIDNTYRHRTESVIRLEI